MSNGCPEIGIELNGVNELFGAVTQATQLGYNFVSTSIVHPRLRREFISGKAVINDLTSIIRSDLIFGLNDWSSLIISKISPWIDVDSPIEYVRRNSEKALEHEINYGFHVGVKALLISIRSGNCINLARLLSKKVAKISQHVTDESSQLFWIHVPMKSPEDESKVFLNSPSEDNPAEPFQLTYTSDTWKWWNIIRTVTSCKRVYLILEVSADLDEQEIQRWAGEPIYALMLPTSLFLTNKKGYPVLSRPHQNFIRNIFSFDKKPRIMITENNQHGDIKHYLLYIEHLFKSKPPPDFLSQYAAGYEDTLQIPLQPLMDNLESYTYEIFEKDPVKYKLYEKAIYLALIDMVPDEEKETRTVVLMVVGAGRGPIVRAALSAADECQRKIKVYAVEKNIYAIIALCAHQQELWKDRVVIVSGDMRVWEPPEKADILVSELLGSFGDNELSPECLDGAERYLKEGGISIPSSYTNYLAPVSTIKLYNSASQQYLEEGKILCKNFEMPYVVMLHNRTDLATPLPAFTFNHPNKVRPIDNTRYVVLKFTMPFDCVIHGFSGFFDTVLYKDVTLSIHPDTHTEALCSWFPLFFPIREPIFVNGGVEVELHFWRCVSTKWVWYEWMVTKPFIGPLHNQNGRSYKIGL